MNNTFGAKFNRIIEEELSCFKATSISRSNFMTNMLTSGESQEHGQSL